MKTIEIVTWNICRHNSWKDKSKELLATFLDLKPDILCLQEVAHDPETHQPFENDGTEIEKALKCQGIYALTMEYQKSEGSLKKTGLGTLFSESFKPVSHCFISFGARDGDIYQSGFIATNHNNLWVINTHLGNRYETRLANWQQLQRWITDNTSSKDDVILCGDLNTNNPGEDTNRLIENAGFKDLWKHLHHENCVTYHSSDWWLQNYSDSEESQKIVKRGSHFADSTLDYIFYKGHLQPLQISLIDKVPTVSDHLGLVGELQFVA